MITEYQPTMYVAQNPEDEDNGFGSVCSMNWGDHVFLFKLRVDPRLRNKGHAKLLVQHVLSENHGRRVYLSPVPYADAELNARQLVIFYFNLRFDVVIGKYHGYEGENVLMMNPNSGIATCELCNGRGVVLVPYNEGTQSCPECR